MSEKLKIPRVTDRVVLDFFEKLCADFQYPNVTIRTILGVELPSIVIKDAQEHNEDFKALSSYDSTLINICRANYRGLQIIYRRGGDRDAKSPVTDEVEIHWNQNENNQQSVFNNIDRLAINQLIVDHLMPFNQQQIAQWNLPDELNQSFSIHSEVLSRLEHLNTKLIEQETELRQQVESEIKQRKSELEEEYKRKDQELFAGYSEKETELDFRREKLDRIKQQIDDRNNTIVRREIRDSMLEDVKSRIDRFGVSQSTEKKRIPVLWTMMTISVLFSSLLFVSLMSNWMPNKSGIDDKNKSAYDQYIVLGRNAFLTFGLISSLLYMVKWQDSWAKKHSEVEFDLQQFNLDINRASWVIESCLEWKKETQSDVPDLLLNSITRDLFKRDSNKQENVLHPSDELASAIMGSASKLKLNIGGNEIEIDPRKVPKETKEEKS